MIANPCYLGPEIEHVNHAEPVAPGDRISRDHRAPYFDVVAIDGEWAWVRAVDTGHQSIIFHAHFQRDNAVVAWRVAA